MLFMYIHTHPVEKCLADKPEEVQRLIAKLKEAIGKSGVKVLGAYGTSHEHTFFLVIDADNIEAIEQAMHPVLSWGNARLIPVTAIQGIAQTAE